jgi:Ca2+-binding RTX toxin-like protein
MAIILGTNDADSLTASQDGDVLIGRDGDDTLEFIGNVFPGGSLRTVAMFGDAGADVLTVGGADLLGVYANPVGPRAYLDGGSDNDTLAGSHGGDTLEGGDGADALSGGAQSDEIHGGDGDDTLDGGAGNDKLHGERGNDSLIGGAGEDRLWGGDGDDTLQGGAGNDTLWGDRGSDTAVFSGSVSDYTIEIKNKVWTVITQSGGAGAEGTDHLHKIERAVFADREIFLDGRNNAPISISLSAADVRENDAGAVIGAVTTRDFDAGETFSCTSLDLV